MRSLLALCVLAIGAGLASADGYGCNRGQFFSLPSQAFSFQLPPQRFSIQVPQPQVRVFQPPPQIFVQQSAPEIFFDSCSCPCFDFGSGFVNSFNFGRSFSRDRSREVIRQRPARSVERSSFRGRGNFGGGCGY